MKEIIVIVEKEESAVPDKNFILIFFYDIYNDDDIVRMRKIILCVCVCVCACLPACLQASEPNRTEPPSSLENHKEKMTKI